MLEGENDFWVQTNATNRTANYNHLEPGNYTFKVKSSNSDGVWNETPTILKFTITPPYWKSNIALVIYSILTLLIIWIGLQLVKKWYKLKQNLVAETISRDKDNQYHKMRMIFFTDISHELRTPLTLIKGTLEKAINDNNFTLNPLAVNRIQNNVIRMNRLINQIMDIRKHETGEFKIKISKNDLNEDLLKIKNAFNDLANINKINYTFNSKFKKLSAFYDVQILEKILFNLLSNAFKYTAENGNISVNLETLFSEELPDIIRKDAPKGNYLKCTVTDNGTGISKEDLPLIFNRFYQATNMPTNQIPGTGIGMELVQKLVEIHKGHIKVDSEENKFTKFTFYIPIEKKHYNSKELDLSTKKALKQNPSSLENVSLKTNFELTNENNANKTTGKPKILVVEDNKEIVELIEESLSENFKILKAYNGKEGYDSIVKNKPDLILSDISMPIEDGVSMLKRVKENKDTAHIPIFILSAKGFEDIKIDCIRLGADDFIEKPFSIEFVKWKIKNNIHKSKDLKERYSRFISVNPSNVTVESHDDKFVRKLVKIIEDVIDDELLSVEYLASEIGMSRANLYRKLKTITGETPVEFIKKIRLKRATQLLKNNNFYISEVASMTGFNNLKYFSKCFKKEYGVTPTQYSNNNKLQPN